MRPVNLIPPEDRRGQNAPLRRGPMAYALVGVLAVALLVVTALVLTNNGIKDREAELAALAARQESATATAEALQPYIEFATLSSSRNETVASLAASRFDWERVLRELALVIPADVWLSGATGGVGGDTGTASEGESGDSLSGAIAGPHLDLSGCARSHRAVAGFVAALEDIDGVTRVGLSSTEKGATTESGGATSSGTTANVSGDCRTRDFIAAFEITIVFDEAPQAQGLAPTGAPAPATPTDSAATDPATSDAVAQEQQASDSTATQTAKAEQAANLGGTP